MYNSYIDIKADLFSVNLELNSLINVGIGDSSTGKTFLIKQLDALKNLGTSKLVSSNIDLSDIVICLNKRDIDLLLKIQDELHEKTIFIDRYDIFATDKLNKLILSGRNRFVIMSHILYEDLDLHAESLFLIKYNKENREFYTERFIDHLGEGLL